MSSVPFSPQPIYELQPILDDPRYEGFAQRHHPFSFWSGKSLAADFLPRGGIRLGWEAPRLADIWQPLEVIGRVRKFNDYPCVNMSIPAFSERAVDALRDILEANGELLPLVSDLGNYWAYNVTTVADVLDRERSEIRWNPKPIRASEIERYDFRTQQLSELTIFRLPERPSWIYVTEPFRRRVQDADLQGFNFIRLWPLPPNVSWRELASKQSRQQENADLAPGRTIKGNSVVFRLLLPHGRREPTEADWAQVARILDELDSLLVDPESTGSYLGSLEGHDTISGEVRVFFSCPDADALYENLRTLREGMSWAGELEIVKRYGHYTDAAAREVVGG